MPSYIALLNWTDQGIRNVKDTAKRAENAKTLARKLGGKLDIHYTMSEYDAVAVGDFPSDEAYNRFALSIAALGNVRTKDPKGLDPRRVSEGNRPTSITNGQQSLDPKTLLFLHFTFLGAPAN